LQREQRAAGRLALSTGAAPWQQLDGWRLNARASRSLQLRCGEVGKSIGVRYLPTAEDGFELTIEGNTLRVRGEASADGQHGGVLRAQLGERRVSAAVVISAEKRQVFFEGRSWPLVLVSPLASIGAGDDPGGGLRAPMPGKVIALLATVGTPVEKGVPLLVLEAMKMEHTLSAPSRGVVRAFHYAAGDQVADGADLVDFETAAS
ncbi:MAG: hypothetical protein RLZZ271_1505, partial [Pseudomonadota bacterium]